ncbi:hypothetical protein NEHOM01_0106 [Nematocida homosporus]|uniref:uncharacterized protein n=1 Tax=Nematocida homosporus TaxID=1912981 RepID=UPI00221F46C1|nr:uncharacterized protein NEHOM01_0106 [Nematocida homosporus]KAI5184361.1 hypothetical protein NEHOM01_0106 [Nematocida homosporus]
MKEIDASFSLSGLPDAYLTLLKQTLTEESKYNEIDQKINNEIITLLLNECATLDEEREEMERSTAELTQAQTEIEELNQTLADQEKILKDRDLAISIKEKEAKEYLRRQKDLETTITKTQAEIDRLNLAINQAQQEVSLERTKTSQLEETKAQITQQSQAEAQARSSLLQTLTETQAKLEETLQSLRLEKEAKTQIQLETERLTQLIQTKTQDLEGKQTSLLKKEEHIATLEHSLAQAKQIQTEQEEALYRQERDLKRRIEELESQIARHPTNTPATTEELAQIRIENEISKAKVEEKDKTIAILQGTIQRLEDLLAKQMQCVSERSPISYPPPEFFSQLLLAKENRPEPDRPTLPGPRPSLNQPPAQHAPIAQVRSPLLSPQATTTTPSLGKSTANPLTSSTPANSGPTQPRAAAKKSSTTSAPEKKRPDSTGLPAQKKKGPIMDFKKELSKRSAKKSPSRTVTPAQSTPESPKDEPATEKKDFSKLFSKPQSKGIFSGKPEASSFFANLSFSDYEPEGQDKD